ncbi:lanthionine synthetase C family protein [Frankia sp. Cj3]|uniref:lanthionine synthetase C family protein n=1 Tax=Frankia sp. Cj3 TaxID=2880976 RepID=UPI001EF6995D|nr:lanthionine synthetase C family protein [Frankia sp. Cj3]
MTALDSDRVAARVRAATLADQLADRLAVPPPVEPCGDRSPSSPRWLDQSLAQGAAGVAVLHGVRAHAGRGGWERAHAWLTRATREGLSAGPGAGLWFGAPAVAFAVDTAAQPGRYERARTLLDVTVQRLIRARLKQADARMTAGTFTSRAEFDVVHGLTGLGAHMLRRDPNGDLIRAILTYLVRLTQPLPARGHAAVTVPGWWTGDVPSRQPHAFAGGHADLGMAHGIAGPLALLALSMRQGITVDGHADALDRICQWLDTWRSHGPSGAWWPERIGFADLAGGRPAQPGPVRASWCYGTPGIARAQQLAGQALGDPARQEMAEEALAGCLEGAQLAQLTDPAVCHGWAGMIITVWRAAADARSPRLAARLPHLLDTITGHAFPDPADAGSGLIEGIAGIALTLHTVATGTSGGWETCLLLT